MKILRAAGKTANSNARKRGFTLTELVVVIGVLVVLAAILVPTVMNASRQARMARYDEHARTLFLAAETRLTNMFYNGELETLNTASDTQKLTTAKVAALSNTPDYADVRYMRLNMDDTYPDDTVLFGALSGQLADESLLFANICVEYSAKTGRIYAVCYSEEGPGFRYVDEEPDGRTDISDRSVETREANSFGYFGVDTLNVADISTSDTLELEYVRLVNSDMLYLEFKLSDASGVPPDADDDVEYTVRLKSGGVEKYSFTFKGQDVTASHAAGTPVTLAAYETSLGSGGNVAKHCIYKEDGRYVLVLDAIDIAPQKPPYSILQRYKNLDVGEMTASVVAEAEGFVASDELESNAEHTLVTLKYGEAQEYIPEITAGTYDYGVANPRHLFNMRYLGNESKYVQVADVDFAAAAAKGCITSSGAAQATGHYPTPAFKKNQQAGGTGQGLFEAPFFGSYTGSYNGTRYIISGMDIRKATLGSSTAVGLFGELYGTVTDVTMQDISASGGENTGALAGICCGKVSGARLLATPGSTALILGSGHVGGLVGWAGWERINNVGYCAAFTNCTVTGGAVKSSGSGKSAGGLIGYLEDNVPFVYNDSSLYTQIQGKNYVVMAANVTSGATNQRIGGVFGQNLSTAYTDVSDLCFNGSITSTHTGAYAGGIVSQVTDGTKYSDCALGPEGSLICRHTGVGGITGYASGAIAKFINCANYGVVSNTVGWTGGIVGRVAYNGTEFTGCTNYNTVTTTKGNQTYAGTGGILGSSSHRVTMTDCANAEGASVSSIDMGLGGLLGRLEVNNDTWEKTVMTNCTNAGTVNGQTSSEQVGGLVGGVAEKSKLEMTGCGVTESASLMLPVKNAGGMVGFSGNLTTLTISGCTVKAGAVMTVVLGSEGKLSSVGGFAGSLSGTVSIESCDNNAGISLPQSSGEVGGVGGIIGCVSGGTVSVSRCTNNGQISSPNKNGTSERIAGIIGANVNATVTVSNCGNTGNITGSTGVAGIVGYNGSSKTVKVEGCNNSGTITAMREGGTTSGSAGGIGAYWNGTGSQTITGCTNNGIITCKGTQITGIGGILGNVPTGYKVTISGCTNSGLVGAETPNTYEMNYVGGIAGMLGKGSTVSGCTSTGEIKPNSSKAYNVGGIVGINPNTGVVENCSCSATITVTTSSEKGSVGGIVGNAESGSTVSGCTFSGTMTDASTYRGGIVGKRAHTNVVPSNCWFAPGSVPVTTYSGTTEARMVGNATNASLNIKLPAPTGVSAVVPAELSETNLGSVSLTVSWAAPNCIAVSGYRVELVIDGAVRSTQAVAAPNVQAAIALSGLAAADSGKAATINVYSTGAMPDSAAAAYSITLPVIN